MVHKIKFLKTFILFFLLFVAAIFTLFDKKQVEFNLLKTILPEYVVQNTDIIPISEKTSSDIKVVFEAQNYESIQKTKQEFIKSVDKNFFKVQTFDVSELLNLYVSNPANFLSYKDKQLLKEKKYDVIYNNSLFNLYNPTGFQLTRVDCDPYLFLDNFLSSNVRLFETKEYMQGNYYDFLNLKMLDKSGLSPDIANKKVFEIASLQKKLSDENVKIYLAGVPIHSYYASKNSTISINIICFLSTFLIMFLTYYYFKSIKILIPIALSIIFGMSFGYIVTRLVFESFQIVTMVFSITLIGIGVDYSYHYSFAQKRDREFFKKLAISLVTTILPFSLLYLTGIELLRQISIFTICGLCAIFFFIWTCYCEFEFPVFQKTIKFPEKIYKILFYALLILGVLGLFKIHLNNSLSTLYMPSGELLKAEKLYNMVTQVDDSPQIVTVEGKNFEDVLQKEEKIADELLKKDIKYLSISKFVLSSLKQKENFTLIKSFYNDKKRIKSEILTVEQDKKLQNIKFKPVVFNLERYNFLKDFFIFKNTTYMLIYTQDKLNLESMDCKIIDVKGTVEKYMMDCTELLLKLFLIFASLILILFLLKGVSLLISSLLGAVLALGILSLFSCDINLFSIIAAYLIFGFTTDYSVFRKSKETGAEDAIFISSLTTCFSFLLLSFSGFALLASISAVLFWGILCAYVIGYVFGKNKKPN